jgi:Icc-related predicted phosphoesterase
VIPCVFASDLHGSVRRADALFAAVTRERPRGVFLGGDLLRHDNGEEYIVDVLVPGFARLHEALGSAAPAVFVILGNDDPRAMEPAVTDAAARGIWEYVHGRAAALDGFTILGYNCVPPTPFRLKDWERYDVSRYVDPGCVAPEDGVHSVPVPAREIRLQTIAGDLAALAAGHDLRRTVCLFHSPPYQTLLDRAALDDRRVDHVPLDVHIGSIAVRRFVEQHRPWLGLHGHVHESARLTGAWMDHLGSTILMSAAHDGPELALVRFDLEQPGEASRELV